MHLDRDMDESMGHDGDNRGEVTRPDAPDVEVGHAIVCIQLESRLNILAPRFRQLCVQKDPAGVAQEAVRPPCNHCRAHETHDRIHPGPAEELARGQRCDGQDRGERVSQHVEIRASEVVIVVLAAQCLVVVILTQEERTDEVDGEADARDTNRLVEANDGRCSEVLHARAEDEERDDGQAHRAGKAAEGADLARAEAVPSIPCMPPRETYAKAVTPRAAAWVPMCHPSASNAIDP